MLSMTSLTVAHLARLKLFTALSQQYARKRPIHFLL